ncbi:hypothetical protein RQM59_07495 [Flavobacteriaceae bacterium S356]|uniref:Glycoside hydrolase family 19 catalytic domain-containing protein n=1 Tax=Asprobacillus argus TaxID=3076534 RepID=A0ABU3LES3_9FLAO|nr:hypothetical protein [Flavobacteriaceae bacterium S356]
MTNTTEAVNTVAKNYEVQKLSAKELQEDIQIDVALKKIQHRFKRHTNTSAERSIVIGDGLIILDEEIAKITVDNAITWTFKVETPTHEDSDIENFMIKKHNDVFRYYLIKYQHNDENPNDPYITTLEHINGDALDTSSLDLSSRDSFDWEFGDGGGGDDDCEGIVVGYEFQACNQGGTHTAGTYCCQHLGAPHGCQTNSGFCGFTCTGTSEVEILDFSHCDAPVGDPVDGDNPNDGDISTGGGSGNPNTGNDDNNNTVTTLVDPRCPLGKVTDPVTGDCVCPSDKVEQFVSGVSMCICAAGRVEDYRGTCVDKCETTLVDLQNVFPNTSAAKLQGIADYINEHGKNFGIDTNEKLQHFLAQAGHESTKIGGHEFEAFEENLNYRISRLGTNNKNWKKYFNTISNPTADPNKANPNNYVSGSNPVFADAQKLGNLVYANRNGNGSFNSGDGYRFRGRGVIHLTGRYNYQQFTNFYQGRYNSTKDFIATPGLLVSDTEIAVISALWFFQKDVLNKLNPSMNSNTSVTRVTFLVNGGFNGLPHRRLLFSHAQNHIICK